MFKYSIIAISVAAGIVTMIENNRLASATPEQRELLEKSNA